MQTHEIPTNLIVAGNNDRKKFDLAALEELAASIKEHGLAQPITVRMLAPDPMIVFGGSAFADRAQYEVVAGERRLRAVRDVLGWGTITCLVRDLDDEAASAIMLTENVARRDLNPIEEAGAYESRIERFGWTPERVAEVAGVSIELVRRRRSLLQLVPEAQTLVAGGSLPVGHAEALARLDHNRQNIALRVFNQGHMSAAQFRTLTNDLFEQQSQDSLFDLETFWTEQVQGVDDAHYSGKQAVVDVPQAADLPQPVIKGTDRTGHIITRYLRDLQAAGFTAEAGAVGNLLAAMVRANFCAIPQQGA